MKSLKKLMAIVMTMAMMFAFASTAMAADNYLTNYETYYTNIVTQGSGDLLELKTIPAGVSGGFASEEAAAAVEWTVVSGSIAGVDVFPNGAVTENGVTYASAYVMVDETAPVGVASIEAKDVNTNATMNFTIVVNGTGSAVNNVNYKIYTSNTATPVSGTIATVNGTDYYGTTSYASAMDAVQDINLADNGIICKIQMWPSDNPGVNTYELNEITINGVTYSNDYATEAGWQYRVYDANGNLLNLSQFVGLDDMALFQNGQALNGCTIVLLYAGWNDADFANLK